MLLVDKIYTFYTHLVHTVRRVMLKCMHRHIGATFGCVAPQGYFVAFHYVLFESFWLFVHDNLRTPQCQCAHLLCVSGSSVCVCQFLLVVGVKFWHVRSVFILCQLRRPVTVMFTHLSESYL